MSQRSESSTRASSGQLSCSVRRENGYREISARDVGARRGSKGETHPSGESDSGRAGGPLDDAM